MTIQWFPGHMLETKKLLQTVIAKTDAVLEIGHNLKIHLKIYQNN